MYDLAFDNTSASKDPDSRLNIDKGFFVSTKLTTKLRQQMQDPLALASGALPEWCEDLAKNCPVLFPLEVRQLFFSCTAFGVSRAVAWLQEKVRRNTRLAGDLEARYCC